ncbi:hypothetical protein N566_17295 [Streptomycetaceae bacterium MP113-05]|nr:hypothetical protein N566_17295 [Streptomycetaceae bacterium MP113-05]
MTKDEARKVARALELVGLPGEAGPADPAVPDGAWRIWRDGQDVTLASLDALIEHLGGETAPLEPGWHDGHPVRGFVFPDAGRG